MCVCGVFIILFVAGQVDEESRNKFDRMLGALLSSQWNYTHASLAGVFYSTLDDGAAALERQVCVSAVSKCDD